MIASQHGMYKVGTNYCKLEDCHCDDKWLSFTEYYMLYTFNVTYNQQNECMLYLIRVIDVRLITVILSTTVVDMQTICVVQHYEQHIRGVFSVHAVCTF